MKVWKGMLEERDRNDRVLALKVLKIRREVAPKASAEEKGLRKPSGLTRLGGELLKRQSVELDIEASNSSKKQRIGPSSGSLDGDPTETDLCAMK
jgi:hypothetical protein